MLIAPKHSNINKTQLLVILSIVALVSCAGREGRLIPEYPQYASTKAQDSSLVLAFGQSDPEFSENNLTNFGGAGTFGEPLLPLSGSDLLGFAGNGLIDFATDQAKSATPLSSIKAFPIERVISPTERFFQRPYATLVAKHARLYGLPEALIHAVVRAESNYKANAISSAGAKGLMQLMDDLSRRFNINPFDAEQNIRVGSYYLFHLLKLYKGDVVLALAAYNAGPGRVAQYGGVPPFKETQQYVKTILSEIGGTQL